MGGQLFAGLLNGYSSALLNKADQERKDKKEKAQAELKVLETAANTGQLSPEQMAATFNRMEEIVSEYGGGGKKKGGFSLGNLIGRFDSGGQKGSGQGTTPAAPAQGGAPPQATGASTAVTQSGPSGAPTGPQPVPPAGAPPATPPQATKGPFGPGSFQDPGEKQIRQAVAMQHAQWKAFLQDGYGTEDQKTLTPEELADARHEFFKSTNTKMHPIVIESTDKDGNKIGIPAMESDQGQVVAQGQLVSNPVIYKDPGNMQVVAYTDPADPNATVKAGLLNRKGDELYDIQSKKQVQNARVLPSPSYAPTSSTTTAEHLDTDTGTKYTTKSTTTKSKGTGPVSLGEPPQPPSRATKPAAAPSGQPKAPTAAAPQKETADQERERVHRMLHPPAAAKTTVEAYKTKWTTANSNLTKAQAALAALKKQKTSRGLTDVFKPDIKTGEAKAAVVKAQQAADNAKRAYDYVTTMQQSIALGLVTPEAVDKVAAQIERTGSFDPNAAPGTK